MAELDRVRHGEGVKTPKTPTSATAAQMLRESPSVTHSPTFGRNHDLDDDHSHQHKKSSVLTKVKDKAKRWRQLLTRKKHVSNTPSWGVALKDDEADEDAEYNGAPMYESEHAPDSYKEHAKQHPRADIVIPEKHVLDFHAKTQTAEKMLAEDKKDQSGPSTNIIVEDKKENPSNPAERTIAEEKEKPPGEGKFVAKDEKQKLPSPDEATSDEGKGSIYSPGKTITETVSEKLAPAYATMSEAAHAITLKIQGMASSVSSSPTKKTMAEEQGNPAGSLDGNIVSVEEKHMFPSTKEAVVDEEKGPVSSTGKTITETVTEKLAPAYATVSDAAHAISSKIQGMASSIPSSPAKKTMVEEQGKLVRCGEVKIISAEENEKLPSLEEVIADKEIQEKETVASPGKTIAETMTEKLAPAYATISDATHAITSKIQEMSTSMLSDDSGNTRNWDKGVSVKEYIKHKLEPGEDDKALSQVISDAISPKKNPDDKGRMEKVKDAVTSLLQSEEEESASSLKTSSSAELIPLSTSAHEVTEESQGRVLQAN